MDFLKKIYERHANVQNYWYFCTSIIKLNIPMVKNLNRIKAVLADKQKTNKGLAEQLDKDPATVSKWCTNSCQPSIETLMQIAKLLEVQTDDLLRLEEIPEIAEKGGK